MNKNDMTYANTDLETGKSETPVIAMIVASMTLWMALVWLVPVVVVVAVVLMIVLAIVQVAISPWLVSMRLSRREMRCEF